MSRVSTGPTSANPTWETSRKGYPIQILGKERPKFKKNRLGPTKKPILLHIAEMYVPESTYRILGTTTRRFSSLVLDHYEYQASSPLHGMGCLVLISKEIPNSREHQEWSSLCCTSQNYAFPNAPIEMVEVPCGRKSDLGLLQVSILTHQPGFLLNTHTDAPCIE